MEKMGHPLLSPANANNASAFRAVVVHAMGGVYGVNPLSSWQKGKPLHGFGSSFF
jgi:hypothetical protein